MTEQTTFNLIDEPWIHVRDSIGAIQEVSVLELFRQSSRFKCLANDLPTQDFAILRVLLAILQRSISPMLNDLDEDIKPAEIWGKLWESSELPMNDIRAYLSKWHDYFDLFDSEHPFMQVPGLRTPKDELQPVSKIIADVPDGDRLFSLRSGCKLSSLTFSEAARWLIHVEAFDTAGIKSGVVGDPNVKGGKSYPRGTGWAGNLGGIFIEGNTLRETLLLNLIVRGNEDDELFPDNDLPAWEQPLKCYGNLSKVPKGRADIFTWQSRCVRLVCQEGLVIGLVLTNGDKLEARNMHKSEAMTAWRRSPNQEKKLGRVPIYLPITHKSNRALWRGLNSIFSTESQKEGFPNTFAPDVLIWAGFLASTNGEKKLSQRKVLQVHGVGFEYGTQSSIVTELIDDTIFLSPFLLSIEGSALMTLACNCVDCTDHAVSALGDLVTNLLVAAGGDSSDAGSLTDRAKAEAYFELDSLFRCWLANLGVDSRPDVARDQWYRQARKLLSSMARKYVMEVGPDAVTGSLKKYREKSIWITAAKAEAWFRSALKKSLPLEGDIIREEGSTSGK
ncbi:type I-E CRISPR-associated protein Cse1/CasA [Lancefieldella rimae]|uniref:type I-E CRISPR-associated protein Cse1/CasA n=1 Tax=Lancefieldella rimae TaxID=1383 RepID=UPI003C6F840A